MPPPELATVDDPARLKVIALESPVLMKPMSNRDKDRAHLRDMIDVGLIDPSWPQRFPPQVGDRL